MLENLVKNEDKGWFDGEGREWEEKDFWSERETDVEEMKEKWGHSLLYTPNGNYQNTLHKTIFIDYWKNERGSKLNAPCI